MKLQKLLLCAALTLATSLGAVAQNLNLVQRSNLTYPGKTCANIAGYVDSLGNEYALVGVSTGMSIVNVTDPANPVEVKAIPNIDDLWKEIKVYGKYAYVTTEGGGGLQIVNMSSLPDASAVVYKQWTGSGAIAGQLESIHALHIDGHYAYLYGSNLFEGGAIAVDLTDPWNPVYAGKYQVGPGNQAYVHDGYVRNDTLYAGHIYAGHFSIVDFTNKAAPVVIATQYTPNNFTHNTWLSSDSKTLFTTDEVNDSYVTAYDITDPTNITLLDKIQSNPGSQSIGHNTHIINKSGNDYAVTSWYKDGFTIVDAGRPHNLIQVANYDNYAGSGGGFEGNWGVYPYLPSGNIIASNIEDGLFVYTPTYVRACYLEGVVTDSATGLPINGASIQILTTSVSESSTLSGDYATGIPSPGGSYSVTYSKPGYTPKTLTGVALIPANVTFRNVALSPIDTFSLSGQVVEEVTSTPIAGARVSITNNDFTYSAITNASGSFMISGMYPGVYTVSAGKWSYVTECNNNQTLSGSSSLFIDLKKGYYDDFTFNQGWIVTGPASTGDWERGIPAGTSNAGTDANPGVDAANDCGNMAYVTGNDGGAAADDDVDGGATVLTSPLFDLTSYTNPYLHFTRWFYNAGGTGTPNDSLSILINNGVSSVLVDFARYNTIGNSSWVTKAFAVSSLLTPTASMKLIVRTADNPGGHLVEAGFDHFMITEGMTGVEEGMNNASLTAYPNPFSNETTIEFEISDIISAHAMLLVTDVTGRIIDRIAIDQQKDKVVIDGLSAGIYFVNIMNGSKAYAPVKIIKTK